MVLSTSDPARDHSASGDRAFNGRILNVNLTTGAIEVEEVPEATYRQLLGGYGVGARLLFDRIPAGADPLGPDNILGFFPGLLTGTPLFGQRFQVVCKSPKNNGWGDASCGGDFGPMLKFAGFDGLLVSGVADRPVYLYISDDTIEVRDAADYWGMLAIECEDRLKADLQALSGKRPTSVALIGPAGEGRSIMAGIVNERGRLAARSGVGAVMGSKLLKAVAAQPSKKVMAQTREVIKTVQDSLKGFNPRSLEFYRTYGTTGVTPVSAISGDAPVKNWGGVGIVEFVGSADMSGMTGSNVNERMEKKYACWHCPVACGAESIDGSDRGEFAFPKHTHRPEYETMGAFGLMTGSNDVDAMIAINHWCNEYGLDTISTGAAISFAIECFEQGALTKEDTDGLELTWGNPSVVLKLVHAIGRRQGFGDVLADGVQRAASRIGQGAEAFAVHIDGEEPPMHDPRLDFGYGASYLGDPTPGRHTLWSPGKSSKFPNAPGLPEERFESRGWGRKEKHAGESAHVMNASGMCSFIFSMAPTDRIPEWINLVTGWDTTHEEVQEVGERIANLRLAFSLKHGNNPATRTMPGRMRGDPPPPIGPHKGKTLDADLMRSEWFEAAGWDPATALPSRAKLESLGLTDVADALGIPV